MGELTGMKNEHMIPVSYKGAWSMLRIENWESGLLGTIFGTATNSLYDLEQFTDTVCASAYPSAKWV